MYVTKNNNYFKNVCIPAGSRCIPVNNLPEDSSIKYWLDELPVNATNEMDSWYRNYGIGFEFDEVKWID